MWIVTNLLDICYIYINVNHDWLKNMHLLVVNPLLLWFAKFDTQFLHMTQLRGSRLNRSRPPGSMIARALLYVLWNLKLKRIIDFQNINLWKRNYIKQKKIKNRNLGQLFLLLVNLYIYIYICLSSFLLCFVLVEAKVWKCS